MYGHRTAALGGRGTLKLLAFCLLILVMLVFTACGGDSDQGSGASLVAVSADDAAQLTQAVGSLYPGFETLSVLGVRDDVYFVLADRTDAEWLIVKLALKKGSEWDSPLEVGEVVWGTGSRSIEIDGVTWSTSTDLNQATDDLSLVQFDSSLSQSVSSDAALGFEADKGSYRAVIGWVVINNMEQEFLIEDESGRLSTYVYAMDIRQTPHAWVLSSKTEDAAGSDNSVGVARLIEAVESPVSETPITEEDILEGIVSAYQDRMELSTVEIIGSKDFDGWVVVAWTAPVAPDQDIYGGQSIFRLYDDGWYEFSWTDGRLATGEPMGIDDEALAGYVSNDGAPQELADWLKDNRVLLR